MDLAQDKNLGSIEVHSVRRVPRTALDGVHQQPVTDEYEGCLSPVDRVLDIRP
jgi:hypothetical protein